MDCAPINLDARPVTRKPVGKSWQHFSLTGSVRQGIKWYHRPIAEIKAIVFNGLKTIAAILVYRGQQAVWQADCESEPRVCEFYGGSLAGR